MAIIVEKISAILYGGEIYAALLRFGSTRMSHISSNHSGV